MPSDIFRDIEDEINIFCPNCGDTNIIAEYNQGFFGFNRCGKCGFKKGDKKKDFID